MIHRSVSANEIRAQQGTAATVHTYGPSDHRLTKASVSLTANIFGPSHNSHTDEDSDLIIPSIDRK